MSRLREEMEDLRSQLTRERAENSPTKVISKKLKKKDPNAPKRPLSQWMLWLSDNRQQIAIEHCDGLTGKDRTTGITKAAGNIWKQLKLDAADDDNSDAHVTLEKYKLLAAQQSAKYAEQMKQYSLFYF